jgi:hypothetical protein
MQRSSVASLCVRSLLLLATWVDLAVAANDSDASAIVAPSGDAGISFELSDATSNDLHEPWSISDEPPLPLAAAETQSLEEMLDLEQARQDMAWPFGYNLRDWRMSWLIAGSRHLGMFSLESLPMVASGEGWGIVTGVGFHFLSGPTTTDMPPRLFDFQIGLQQRKWFTESLGYDISWRIGAFSDFEGSAREGVRYPGHAVGYWRQNPDLDLVFGLEYLDRDDIQLLPVAGMILTPRPDVRLELVFPRPRAAYRLSRDNSVYVGGELGGGTWAIERVTKTNDVATYRDFRLMLGWLSHSDEGNAISGLEIGYVFGRALEYRSNLGDTTFRDAVLIQLTHQY